MKAALLSEPAIAVCSTSNANAVSSAAKLPACLSSRSCDPIVVFPLAVNVPDFIVHATTRLPMCKAALCLEGRFLTSMGGFQ